MKPYLYILAVLLVGGGIGYYVGQRSAPKDQMELGGQRAEQNDRQKIQDIIERQIEAYKLHDSLLLFRDCTDSFVEINSNSGDSYGLSKAMALYHDFFKSGKSVVVTIKIISIDVLGHSALVKATYSKTSEVYEKEGVKGRVGEGIWLLSKPGNHWMINSYLWKEHFRDQ